MDELTLRRWRHRIDHGDVIQSPRGEFVLFSDVVEWINAQAIHLNSGGKDPDAKIYTKRDVEALVAITRAAERMHEQKSASADSATVSQEEK